MDDARCEAARHRTAAAGRGSRRQGGAGDGSPHAQITSDPQAAITVLRGQPA